MRVKPEQAFWMFLTLLALMIVGLYVKGIDETPSCLEWQPIARVVSCQNRTCWVEFKNGKNDTLVTPVSVGEIRCSQRPDEGVTNGI